MARVLLYTVDVDLPGLPINGGVLRVRQLQRVLRRLGHEVLVSMPVEQLLGAGAPEAVTTLGHSADTLAEVAGDVNPDLVLCEQWHLARSLSEIRYPLWLDLHGSLLGENSFRHGGSEVSARYLVEVNAKIAAFDRADAVTCTGGRQRLYFGGWRALSATSYDWDVVHVPLSVPAQEPAPAAGHQGLHFLFAGNLWPWIDLRGWLPAFLDAVAARPHDQVWFYIDDPLGQRDGASVIGDDGAGAGYDRLQAEDRLHVSGRMDHDSYLQRARQLDIAVDLFSSNWERELAVTTRTLEYLAIGLPVLYPSHAELAELVSGYGCGWVLDLQQPQEIGRTLAAIDEAAVHRRQVAARAGSALERLEQEATSRCAVVVDRLLSGAPLRRHQAGARRLAGQSGVIAVAELRNLKRQLAEERARSAELEQRLAAVSRTYQLLRSLEQQVGELERQTGELEQQTGEVGEQLGELGTSLQARLEDQTDRLGSQSRARHIAAALRPGRSARRWRSLRLLWLYLDHLLTRTYLAVWQRIKGSLIFPGTG